MASDTWHAPHEPRPWMAWHAREYPTGRPALRGRGSTTLAYQALRQDASLAGRRRSVRTTSLSHDPAIVVGVRRTHHSVGAGVGPARGADRTHTFVPYAGQVGLAEGADCVVRAKVCAVAVLSQVRTLAVVHRAESGSKRQPDGRAKTPHFGLGQTNPVVVVDITGDERAVARLTWIGTGRRGRRAASARGAADILQRDSVAVEAAVYLAVRVGCRHARHAVPLVASRPGRSGVAACSSPTTRARRPAGPASIRRSRCVGISAVRRCSTAASSTSRGIACPVSTAPRQAEP